MMAKGIHKKWLKALARALEKILPTRGKYVAKKYLKQASAYLQKNDLKKQIDKRVYEQVFESVDENDPICVISHSLGTITAYSLLMQSRNALKPKVLFTLGSP